MRSSYLLLLCLLTACSERSEVVEVTLAEHYDPKQILGKLENEGIYCQEDDNTLICNAEDFPSVSQIIQETSFSNFPPGRSIYLGMPGLHDVVILELKDRNIQYEIRPKGSENWIIYQKEDAELVRSIIEAKTKKLRRTTRWN